MVFGWVKHGLDTLFHFGCIPPKVTSMQNFIDMGYIIEVSLLPVSGGGGGGRGGPNSILEDFGRKQSTIKNFSPLAQSVWK